MLTALSHAQLPLTYLIRIVFVLTCPYTENADAALDTSRVLAQLLPQHTSIKDFSLMLCTSVNVHAITRIRTFTGMSAHACRYMNTRTPAHARAYVCGSMHQCVLSKRSSLMRFPSSIQFASFCYSHFYLFKNRLRSVAEARVTCLRW